MRLAIERDWRGAPLPAAEHAWIALARQGERLEVRFDAPLFGDPLPPMAAGSTPGLWNYEVIELFIADAGEHYLELEFGPGGHYLALELRGIRQVVRQGLPLRYSVEVDPGTSDQRGRYRGLAELPIAYLPSAAVRSNAYAIHGVGADRKYCAHAPVPGEVPDFHRLQHFVPLCW